MTYFFLGVEDNGQGGRNGFEISQPNGSGARFSVSAQAEDNSRSTLFYLGCCVALVPSVCSMRGGF